MSFAFGGKSERAAPRKAGGARQRPRGSASAACLVPLCLLCAVPTSAEAPEPQAKGTVNEVMIGITYPASNIVFEAGYQDPAAPAEEFVFETYTGWPKVEAAAIAVAESANLLAMAGRLCSNAEPAPMQQDDWGRWVEALRASAMAAYEAARAQSQERLVEVSEALTASCSNCHTRYLDVGGDPENRCRP